MKPKSTFLGRNALSSPTLWYGLADIGAWRLYRPKEAGYPVDVG
jgi:hypothetical protein